jgi:hypothetical protein
MAKGKGIGPTDERTTVNIRKIENGFIVSKSGVGPKGEYFSKETYTPAKPEIVVQSPGPKPKMSKPRNGLLDAIRTNKK